MDFKTRVTRIGNHALNTEDQMLVLFGESVTQEIAEISISQEFLDNEMKRKFTLKKGDQVLIGDTAFDVEYVGSLVQENMRTINHINLVFNHKGDHLESAVYLDGKIDFSNLKIGSEITYSD